MSALILENVSKIFAPPHRGWKNCLSRAPGKPGFQALNDVRFTVESGEFFGLLGPNGAGKTTLISILAGLASATSGPARVCGHAVETGGGAWRERGGQYGESTVVAVTLKKNKSITPRRI